MIKQFNSIQDIHACDGGFLCLPFSARVWLPLLRICDEWPFVQQ